MPLDWKEIANRARAFSKDWKHAERVAFLFTRYEALTNLSPGT